MSKTLVIVESPAKAKTIGKYLGSGFHVEASVGHIRDLPTKASELPKSAKGHPWSRLAVDTSNDYKPVYVLTKRGREQVKKLKALLKDAPELLLATDEDREGEAIAWHLVEALKPKVPVRRLVFHEITKKAIEASLTNSRTIDMDLVRAQETRRVLDRLYGYDLSELLWKKVRRGLSAGRVQSPAVRLVVTRERERMAFVSADYWAIKADIEVETGKFTADLVELNGKRVAIGRDFDAATGKLKGTMVAKVALLDEKTAKALAAGLVNSSAKISDLQTKAFKESPFPPFTTSKLQQDANRRLKWPAARTMRAAQRLYENGWITYMRTDSVSLSNEAITAARNLVTKRWGANYLPATPRVYKSKAKGAQEAHEAIRPAGDAWKDPSKCTIGTDEKRLYELIWKRAVSCQMADAKGERMTVDTTATTATGQVGVLRARGKTYTFPGFRVAFVGTQAQEEGEDAIFPAMTKDMAATPTSADPTGKSTQPPARLSEATLVQRLEELGIGRPSTYAAIIETVQDRGYVFKKGTALVPTWAAFAVTRLMEDHFERLADFAFTAKLEDGLDHIASGTLKRERYLEDFYRADKVGLTPLIEAALEEAKPQDICSIPIGEFEGTPVVARVGRFGPYLQMGETTQSLDESLPPDEVTLEKALELLKTAADGPKVLGTDADEVEVTLHNGRYGWYVQLGEGEGKEKPKRASLLTGMEAGTLTLEQGLQLLSLPRNLGQNDEGHDILVFNGRYGPYVKCDKANRSLPKDKGIFELTKDEALVLLASAPVRRGQQTLKDFGQDPEGRTLVLRSGRFGPYVTDGEYNATVRKGMDAENLSMDDAMELLAAKRAKGPPPKKKGRARKAPAKKPAAKKATAKKPAAKKPAAKKPAAKKPAARKPAAKRATAKPVE